MLKLIKCEFLKLKRKPLVFISLLLSVFMPLAYAFGVVKKSLATNCQESFELETFHRVRVFASERR